MVQAAKSFSNSARKKTASWFVARAESVSGPFTAEQLHQRVDQGKIDLGDYCWKQGFAEWRPLCSVADLDLSSRPCLVSPYPSVSVPTVAPRKLRSKRAVSAQMDSASRKRKGNPWEQEPRQKPVTVRLQKQSSRAVSHWERFGMILFAFAMAWLSAVVALNEAQDGFEYLYDQTLVGEEQDVHGNQFASKEHWKWEWAQPLMSAPGLKALPQAESLSFKARVLQPVVSRDADVGDWRWRGQSLQWSSGQHFRGVSFRHKTDPVYVQPYTLSISWRASEPEKFKASTPGYPGF